MLELTKAVISESEGYDSKNSKAMKEHLKHLYQKVLDQKEVRLSFINTRRSEDVQDGGSDRSSQPARTSPSREITT